MTMRVYRRYRCDYGHEWTVRRQRDEPESAADTHCPSGHEAITCNEELPADEVQIVIRPAARIVDRVTGQVWKSGRYFIALLDREGQELCVSSQDYSWEDAVRLAGHFQRTNKVRAMELWARKGL